MKKRKYWTGEGAPRRWKGRCGRNGLAALCCLMLLLIAAPAALAEEEGDELQLPAVDVVAKSVIEGNVVDGFGSTTTVVSREQIEALNAVDLPEALRRVPGVTISRHNHVGSWGGGEGGAVFIRGMGSSRPGSEIKTYIDGVPMYMGPWNHPLMDLLPVDAAESLEVAKGPQPQKYGNSLSAVNMRVKRHRGDGSATSLRMYAGSYGTMGESIEHEGGDEDFNYYLGQGYVRSDGHRKDSWGNKLGYYANLGFGLSDNWDLSVLALGTTNRSSDPGPDTAGGVSDGTYGTNAQLLSATLSHDHGLFDGEFKFFVNTGEGNWKDQAGTDDDCLNDFTFYGVRLKETAHPWQGADLTVGLDVDAWQSTIHFTYDNRADRYVNPDDYYLTMPYVSASQLIGDREGWFAQPSLGMRYYEHNEYDSETAPFAGLVFGYADTEAHVSVSRGVVYPGHDVIAAIWVPFGGAETLEAETTDHFEAGVSQRFGDMATADVTYFHDDGRNRYVVNAGAWSNVEKYDIHGWEFTLTLTPTDNFSVFAGLTTQETTPDDLPYAPATTLSGGFTWRFLEDFTLNMDCEYVDEMYAMSQARVNNAANLQEVDSHFVTNARVGWDFESEILGGGELYLAVENLLDEEYAYKPNYPMPGINGTIGLKLNF
ncbi:iron complex outermembrane recepter protein [Paucidesulfovibrio gracilis DSM 16080]|uniref:Iron complex outermembrane recepter protein n=1 Tax=Paucidesulfovibrio gracilis DSM 16080 TaxID=1121449 RepID=A0A1T4WY11_9BACT|nr:TonB-dependent receptor plug domain-containing protein [Paucidesulfovibrio gracilis]SKA82047.1 iron complex outermembrane recepter protein [Paucidesulfovibrio gracilis DSM 16080]